MKSNLKIGPPYVKTLELVRCCLYSWTSLEDVVWEKSVPKSNTPKKLALAEARIVFLWDSDLLM